MLWKRLHAFFQASIINADIDTRGNSEKWIPNSREVEASLSAFTP